MGRAFTVKTVHKGMYPGINFKDDTVGAEPTGWVSNNGDGCTTTVIAVLGGHRKVLQLYDGNAATSAIIYRTFTQGLNMVVEIWFTKSSVAASTTTFLRLREGATTIIYLRFQDDDLDNYPNGGPFASIKDNFLVANTLSHFKFILNDTANTYDCYIDGILEGAGIAYANNSTSGIGTIYFETESTHSGFYGYIDAIGVSTDTNYNIGDNIHYRHFKESTDSLELDDVGTQGADITWVDWVDTAASFEIVQEFNAHKKILRGYYSSGAGGFDYSEHNFATQSKMGWFACWIKSSDITTTGLLTLKEDATNIILFGIRNSQFQVFTGGAYRQVTGSPIPVNDTWYFIYIQWYDAATDTFDAWIDNIQYEDATNCGANQTSGINKASLSGLGAASYIYIDAPISSLEGDERADNRTFDYNDTYTKTDITSDVKNVNYENKIYSWRTATLYAKSSYEFTNVFFEIYDVNSVLAMRGEIKNRILEKRIYRYPLRDMNWDDLNEAITHVFTTDKIHDPTDSTSMLKTALPNVDQTEGDLILAEADTEAATYSPILRFYPTYMFLRDISDLADSVTIVKASGIVLLDDDLASGDSLNVDIAADKRKMAGEPIPTDILETINYFEILGAINPDTGQRFYKLIDNSGDDKKRPWRYINNGFESQTDVDAYATALALRTVPVRIIRFSVQNLGVHDMGTTLNYKYIKGVINIAQANYYIISETIDFDKNLATIVLSEGLIEGSKYSAAFERPENYLNSFASEIYETDINTVFPYIHLLGTATFGVGAGGGGMGYIIDADNEGIWLSFYLDAEMDESRDVVITITYARDDANNDAFDYQFTLNQIICDGSAAINLITSGFVEFPACAQSRARKYQYTIPIGDRDSDFQYAVTVFRNAGGGGDARDITITNASVKYYVKRSV